MRSTGDIQFFVCRSRIIPEPPFPSQGIAGSGNEIAIFEAKWANCGIAKHHGSLVTEQNFAKHGDRIFSSTGSFINSNLWKIQIIVQLNLNFQEICTSCSIFVRSFWFIQATDSEIFNMPYGILEMRNDQFSKESGTNFAVFHSIKVSTWLNYF